VDRSGNFRDAGAKLGSGRSSALTWATRSAKRSQMEYTRCSGWVRSLRGQVVVFTGHVSTDSASWTQNEAGSRVLRYGGEWRDEFSSLVTLVVHGDLSNKIVVD